MQRFDHHCPMLASAIGLQNYKYYLQFLWYSALLSVYLQIIAAVAMVVAGRETLLIVLIVLAGLVGELSVLPLCVFHAVLVARGYTTRDYGVENWKLPFGGKRVPKIVKVAVDVREYCLQRPGRRLGDGGGRVMLDLDVNSRPWDHGLWRNWSSVMGIHWWEWVLPITPTFESQQKHGTLGLEFNELTKNNLRTSAREIVDNMTARWELQMETIDEDEERFTPDQDLQSHDISELEKPQKAYIPQ